MSAWTVVLVLFASAIGYAAPPRTPRLAFEIQVGIRATETAPVLDMLAEALETHGFIARPASMRRLLGGRMPLPGIPDSDMTSASIAQQVSSGVGAYVAGKFDDAAATLSRAIELIHRNPGLLVSDTQNADAVTRAYIALALAQSRLGQSSQSNDTMAELIRITRGQPISRSDFGPDADKLYRAVLKELQSGKRGSLAVTASDDRALIFIDGSLRGMGKATLGDLFRRVGWHWVASAWRRSVSASGGTSAASPLATRVPRSR